MGHFKKIFSIFTIVSFVLFNTAAWADEGVTGYDEKDTLRQEVQILKERLRALERRLEITETKAERAQARVSVAPAAPRGGFELPEFLQDLTISGMVMTSGNYNANEPDDQLNRFHEFDATANTFQLDEVQLIFQKEPEEGIGFRTDLIFAEVADNIASGGTSSSDNLDVEQGYVSYRTSLYDHPLDIWFGKYTTLAGAEVIEDPSGYNWNITHSFLFYYTIPFTHTGVRVTYAPYDWLTVIAGVNNGWDVLTDNNNAKTLETGLGLTPYDWLSWFTSFYHGAEQSGDQGNQRSLISSVLTVTATDKLTLMVDGVYGFEEDIADVSLGTLDAEWWGIAGYLRYMLSDEWGLSLRAELFNDHDGVRTLSANGGPSTRTEQELWEFTVTTDYTLYEGLVLRAEYRHDESDKNLFQDKGNANDSQDIVSLQTIYSF